MRRTLIPVVEAVLPFVVGSILWEAFSLFGPFPPKLFPGVVTIASTFVRILGNGILLIHVSDGRLDRSDVALLRLAWGHAAVDQDVLWPFVRGHGHECSVADSFRRL